MNIKFDLQDKTYLLIELGFYGKDFKIEKFKTHAVLNYKSVPDNYDVSDNDGSINELLLKGKIIGTLSDIYEKKVKGFKIGNKTQLLMNIVDFSKIDQTKPLLLVQLVE